MGASLLIFAKETGKNKVFRTTIYHKTINDEKILVKEQKNAPQPLTIIE
jgi:hypothetical protein